MKVKIRDSEVDLHVYQAKSVWVAAGHHEGRWIRTTGRSATSARSRWREAAQYQIKWSSPDVAGARTNDNIHPIIALSNATSAYHLQD
jgi:hypothetical protein